MFRKRRTAKHQARLDREQVERIELGKYMSWADGCMACECCDAEERDIKDVLSAMGLELSSTGIVQYAALIAGDNA